jgi:hypothetical protein
LVMLFEPGGRIEPRIGCRQTEMSRGSVMVLSRL